MIGWLSGGVRLRDAKGSTVIIDTGGVGYKLLVSLQTLAQVPEVGERCELWVHTHAREDVLELFGFASLEERQMFSMLLSVPQVGPRLALTVLGGFPLQELVMAISGHELATLQKIPGVGKKTAERILIDLSEKVAPLGKVAAESTDDKHHVQVATSFEEDALTVLVNLGFKRKPVEQAIREELAAGETSGDSLDDLVRAVLARLMR